jgi:hypothetical protein
MVLRQRAVEVAEQLGELLREVVGHRAAAIALERERRARVGARRAAQAEVDTAGVHRGQQREDLGDLERAVVRQHHAARADADALRRRGHRRDQHLGRVAGEHRSAVVLGQPVAVVSELVGEPRQVDRVRQGVGVRRAFRYRGLVQNAEEHLLIMARQ